MFKKSYLQLILLGLIAVSFFASCDKDFNELGTDIVGDDHFNFDNYDAATVKAYNQKLGPIASNNLPINPLGFYDNPAFGKTQANFVTQLELGTFSPEFNNTDPEDYDVDPTAIDSVILEIPYYYTLEPELDANDNRVYSLDSIYGPENATADQIKFTLEVYRSNYFLRDLDPSQSLGERQLFYTDMDATIDAYKIGAPLNDSPNVNENTAFFFDKREHLLPNDVDEDGTIEDNTTEKPRTPPSMRLHLNKQVFTDLILNPANSGHLANNNLFKNFFRGLYFKTVSNGMPGQMAMLNFKGGKITIYYQEDKKITDSDGVVTWERPHKTLVLNLNGNTVSLLNNITEDGDYVAATNSTAEASKLYLKGGEGSMAVIDLFGSIDDYKYVVKTDGAGQPVNDDEGDPLYIKQYNPNGVPDELDDLRYPLVENTTDHSPKERWLINDARLTFTIDQTAMAGAAEPNRIFLYDLNNKKPLVDYTFDVTSNSIYPKFNKNIHGGIIEREGSPERGVKYRIRITNHLRNLIMNDSTNVRLGLSVTESINNVASSKLRTPNANSDSAPSMSVMNPLGTIIYGTNIPQNSENYPSRLKLDIYYTKPE